MPVAVEQHAALKLQPHSQLLGAHNLQLCSQELIAGELLLLYSQFCLAQLFAQQVELSFIQFHSSLDGNNLLPQFHCFLSNTTLFRCQQRERGVWQLHGRGRRLRNYSLAPTGRYIVVASR